jgi:hypothetical protein
MGAANKAFISDGILEGRKSLGRCKREDNTEMALYI